MDCNATIVMVTQVERVKNNINFSIGFTCFYRNTNDRLLLGDFYSCHFLNTNDVLIRADGVCACACAYVI